MSGPASATPCGTRRKIVFLGMMTRIPVAGAVWGTMHYLVGLERLGYEPYYVEAHARTPTMLMTTATDDSSALAAAFIDRVMRRFGMAGRWAFHALHDDGRVYGMSDGALATLYRDAALIINYHGGTIPLPEHTATGRLIYLGTDPVDIEIEVRQGRRETIDFLAQHRSFWTWGLNLGRPDCRVPLPLPFEFRPQPPAVVRDLWDAPATDRCRRFTTVGNWRQPYRDIEFEGSTTGASTTSSSRSSTYPAGPIRSSNSRSAVTGPTIRRSSNPTAGTSATRWTSRPTSISTATTSATRGASSPWPRTRTCGSGAAGSASGAPNTSPRAGP